MSETCDFSIEGDYDGDTAQFYNESTVKARKPHKCFECGETIPAGARYKRASGKWEGQMETYHFCAGCDEAAGEFVEGARNFGMLWEEFESNWEDGAHLQACLNRLSTAAAKEHMLKRWLQWKGIAK